MAGLSRGYSRRHLRMIVRHDTSLVDEAVAENEGTLSHNKSV